MDTTPPVIAQLDISLPDLPQTDADANRLAQNIARVATAYPTLVPRQDLSINVLHFHFKTGMIQQTITPATTLDNSGSPRITIDVGVEQQPALTIRTTEADKPCGRNRTSKLLLLAQTVSGMFGNTMVHVPEADLYAIQGKYTPNESKPTDPYAVQQASCVVSALRNAQGNMMYGYT